MRSYIILESENQELKKRIKELENNKNKPQIELITCESGDWEVLKYKTKNDKDYFSMEGHKMSNHNWIELLEHLGYEVNEKVISDEDMEYGRY